MKNISTLVKINLLSRFGYNEARYSKDSAKKRRLYFMMGSMVFVMVVLLGYILALAWAFCNFGAAESVPAYMMLIASLIIFFFTVFKAGSVIFQMQTYEMLISLPLSAREIVVSRFLTMYLEDFLLSALMMIPGCIMYAFYARTGALFWLMTLIGIFIVPLLPLVAASVIGALISAIGARVRHRNLIMIVLSILVGAAIFAVSFLPMMWGPAQTIELNDVSQMGSILVTQINHSYFMAGLYSAAVIDGNLVAYGAFLLISIGAFLLFAVVVERKFVNICSALTTKSVRGDYHVGAMKQKSVVMALFQKEIKRYFSSNIYVMNTIIGYVMMLLIAAVAAVVGLDKLESSMQMPSGVFTKVLPFLFAWTSVMAPITACSISMEGKNWWIPMSLPITARDIVCSKILVNLTFSIPSCFFAAILAGSRISSNPQAVCLLFAIPAAYSFFAAVSGIVINLHLPLMKWENEVVVVKQSGATMITVFSSFIIAGIPGALMLALSAGTAMIFEWGMVILLIGAAVLLYCHAARFDLRRIEA